MRKNRIFRAQLVLLAAGAVCVMGNAQDREAGSGRAEFVGTWEETWPGIKENATHVVSFVNNSYAIEGWSPLTKSYGITDVRLDGNVLKFNEKTAAFVVEYEIRVKGKDILTVRAKGMSGWRDDILWRRIEDAKPSEESSASAQQAFGAVASIEGTVWDGKDSDGDYYEFDFLKGGRLRFKTDTSRSSVVTFEDEGDYWTQNGNIVIIVVSDYATRLGTIKGNRMTGKAWNFAGKRWTWEVTKKR